MNPAWMRMIEGSKAAKKHRCTWCGEPIQKGEQYAHWLSIDAETPVVNKMHHECFCASSDRLDSWNDYEYEFFKNERPQV